MIGPEEVEARHVVALQAFVLRARRVRAHSLATDIKELVELQKPKFVVHYVPSTGEQRITIPIPDEERVESAAARLRPLLLEREVAYHGKVMAALLYFARKGSAPKEYVRRLRNLKKLWAAIKPNGTSLRFYEVHQQRGDEEATRASDNELAFAWIYGDVVHADAERRAATERYGVLERFRAAVPVVALFMLHTIYTLGLIEGLVKSGALPDLGDVLEQDLVVTSPSCLLRQQSTWPSMTLPMVHPGLPRWMSLSARGGGHSPRYLGISPWRPMGHRATEPVGPARVLSARSKFTAFG